MTEREPLRDDDIPIALVDEHHRGLSAIWLIPLVAALIGAWLLYKTLAEIGPEIVIRFNTAEGIEAGKTRIKYREVNVGLVTDVRFADDLSHVLVTAQLAPEARNHMKDATRFWVVRPRLGAGEISGLGTLVSGAYIAMDPSTQGQDTLAFTGLERPPALTSDKRGATYRLRADGLGSLNIGAPVYFRQIKVGEVIDYQLADDHAYVDISIFIASPHDSYVRQSTRFWDAGGVGLKMDASGFAVELGSVASLLSGGIAFESPNDLSVTAVAAPDSVFPLYESHAKSLEERRSTSFPYVVYFNDTVRGLSVGAPVEFRGIRLGEVQDIQMRFDPATGEITIPVLINIGVGPGFGLDTAAGLPVEQLKIEQQKRLEDLVSKGMRARLQTGNLLTGQLFIEFDMVADAKPAQMIYGGTYPRLPTQPSLLTGLANMAARLLDRLEKLPVEATLENIRALTASANHLVAALDREAPGLVDELTKTAGDVRRMLTAATAALTAFEGATSENGVIGAELQGTLAEVKAAARSLRVMTDYLERHPEALLKGKPTTPEAKP
ncbi:MAG: intermembrane transport protein PqiB [Porticoccaceae bacterium]